MTIEKENDYMGRLTVNEADALVKSGTLSKTAMNKMREEGLISQRRRGTKRFLKTKEGTFVSPQLYFQGMKGSTASNKMIEFRTKFNNLVNEFAIENPSK